MNKKPFDESPLKMVTEVFPGDTNSYGTMFGGRLISIMDKAAGICASKYAHEEFVTASIDNIRFLTPIKVGYVIEVEARVVYTSIHTLGIRVEAISRERKTWVSKHCCTAFFFMVALDDEGNLVEMPQIEPKTGSEKREMKMVQEMHLRMRSR